MAGALRRQVQHHGKGSSPVWREKGKERPRGSLPGHSPAFAATGVPSAWWTPAWNLTFSTTRQTCPGWRSGCTCGFPRRPLGPSRPAPFPPHPSTSSPCEVRLPWPGNTPAAPRAPARSSRRGSHSCRGAALCWRRLCLRRAPARAPRSGTAVATRLRLRPRLAQLGWDCERHLHRSQLPLAPPNFSPPRGSSRPRSHGPHPGAIDAPLGSYLQSPDPAQSPRPGEQPHSIPSRRCQPGSPTLGGWRLPWPGERQDVYNFVPPPVSFSPFSCLLQQLPPKGPRGEWNFISLSGAKLRPSHACST